MLGRHHSQYGYEDKIPTLARNQGTVIQTVLSELSWFMYLLWAIPLISCDIRDRTLKYGNHYRKPMIPKLYSMEYLGYVIDSRGIFLTVHYNYHPKIKFYQKILKLFLPNRNHYEDYDPSLLSPISHTVVHTSSLHSSPIYVLLFLTTGLSFECESLLILFLT